MHKAYPYIKQYQKSGFIIYSQDPLLEVLCVNKCMCMRRLSLSQFPTDQEEVRKREREEKEGEERKRGERKRLKERER